MILERFYDDKLAQASYLVGCSATGEALIVDPNRDLQPYVDAATSRGLRVTHVTETHIHADFASGSRELAQVTGATLYLSGEGGESWQYGFAAESNATVVRDGDEIGVGNILLEVLHTPGHTPEHISFLVTDRAATDQPMGLFSGDFLFVGDVGRPDLLEKAAGVGGTMVEAAHQLFASLQRVRELPDHLQVWPAHGAGSACGKALGAVPQSTLGYERAVNWAFSHDNEDEFVQAVLTGQPEPPKYFARMKQINRDGPDLLGGIRAPGVLEADDLDKILASDAVVVDTRSFAAFSGGHIPGTLSIPYDPSVSFTNWAGWLLPADRDCYLIVDRDRVPPVRLVRDLAMVALDRVAGVFDRAVVDAWCRRHGELETTETTDAPTLARRLEDGSVHLVDVRGAAEWGEGRIPGSPNIPLGYLADRIEELPADLPIVLYCQTGARSGIGTSILQSAGNKRVVNLQGGIVGWMADEGAIERGATPLAGV